MLKITRLLTSDKKFNERLKLKTKFEIFKEHNMTLGNTTKKLMIKNSDIKILTSFPYNI